MSKTCLVACVSSKQPRVARAEEMYTSPLFKKAREYALARFDRWLILSAKYGVLDPDQQIEPYDLTLNNFSQAQRIAWSSSVLDSLVPRVSCGDYVAFVAGTRYRDLLAAELRSKGCSVR